MPDPKAQAVGEIGAILNRLTLDQGKAALEEAWKWYVGGPWPVIVDEANGSQVVGVHYQRGNDDGPP